MSANAKWTEADVPDQSGRVAIVTGSNTGLGYETARVLAAIHFDDLQWERSYNRVAAYGQSKLRSPRCGPPPIRQCAAGSTTARPASGGDGRPSEAGPVQQAVARCGPAAPVVGGVRGAHGCELPGVAADTPIACTDRADVIEYHQTSRRFARPR